MTLTLDRTHTSGPHAWEGAIATTLDEPRADNDTPHASVDQYPAIGATALDLMAAIAGPTGTGDYGRRWDTAFEIVTAMLTGKNASACRSDRLRA